MSRAGHIVCLIDEHRGKADDKEQQGPAAPVKDSRADSQQAQQVAIEKKEVIRKDIAKLLQDIRTRHPKPASGAPVGGILPPARMK